MSRRTVIALTPSSCASSVTLAAPRRRTSATIRDLRSATSTRSPFDPRHSLSRSLPPAPPGPHRDMKNDPDHLEIP